MLADGAPVVVEVPIADVADAAPVLFDEEAEERVPPEPDDGVPIEDVADINPDLIVPFATDVFKGWRVSFVQESQRDKCNARKRKWLGICFLMFLSE